MKNILIIGGPYVILKVLGTLRNHTTRRLNPLKKMQSLMAIAAKLIRVFYAVLAKGVAYDPQKMLSDIHRQPQAA